MKVKKCWNHLLYADIIRFFLANIEGENLHIFWTTWRIWTKFSEEMWLVTKKKNRASPSFLETNFWKNTQGIYNEPPPSPPSLLRVKEMHFPFILVEKQNHDQANSDTFGKFIIITLTSKNIFTSNLCHQLKI